MDQHCVSQPPVKVNGKRSGSFVIEWSVRQGCCYFLFSPSLLWGYCLVGLEMRRQNPALIGIPLVGSVRVRVSAFADNITVFVSRHSETEAVKKAVARYEQVAEPRSTVPRVRDPLPIVRTPLLPKGPRVRSG